MKIFHSVLRFALGNFGKSSGVRYAFRLPLATALLMALTLALASCKSHKKTVGREEVVIEHTVRRDRPDIQRETEGYRIVEEACTWIGTPYVYAGQEKGIGTDCSGMVMMVYLDVTGKKLPRNSARQAEFCREIKPHEVKAGDLVFFATGKDSTRISHVGIMMDEVQFVHASSSKGVCISKMAGNYYPSHFVMYGRVP